MTEDKRDLLTVSCEDGIASRARLEHRGTEVRGVTDVALRISGCEQTVTATLTVETFALMCEVRAGNVAGKLSPDSLEVLQTLPAGVLRDLADEMLTLADTLEWLDDVAEDKLDG